MKAQIQPHFLHNTLNGIYNETIKKSEKAGDMIIKLSELMRFMFQEGKKHYITVSKELALIDNYVQLESFRFGDRVKVESEIGIGSTFSFQIPFKKDNSIGKEQS